jgi:vacuolar-type H+-ATPase subunit I/STV1
MAVITTIASGDEFDFYREDYNEDQVCLRLFGDIEFQASQKSVLIKIPIAVWEFIRQTGAADLDLVNKTDDHLLEIVETEVDRRIIKRDELKKAEKDGSAGNHFDMVKSLADRASDAPREDQVEQRLDSYRKKRNGQREILKQMKKFSLADPYQAMQVDNHLQQKILKDYSVKE